MTFFMRNFFAALSLVLATVVGAGAQTNFNPTGLNSFTNLTFSNATTSPPSPYTAARLLFGVTGFTFPAPGSEGKLLIGAITLSGDGLTNNTELRSTLELSGNLSDPLDFDQYTPTDPVEFSTSVSTWNSANSLANFSSFTQPGVFASPGARIYYAIAYGSSGSGTVNTTSGNIVITAVPEPSTYFAAAGLLALFLWSARRHLFKSARR